MIQKQSDTNQLAYSRTDFALERTHMAATRTFFALLRTGIAIAGGGTLVTTILGNAWPEWVVGFLSAVFILIGFTIMIAGLHRYTAIAKIVAVDETINIIPPGLLIVLTIILQAAILTVLILYLVGNE